MPHVVKDVMHQRELAISELRCGIAKAISDAVRSQRGITGPEILIALNEAATRWAREMHKEDNAAAGQVEERDPAGRVVESLNCDRAWIEGAKFGWNCGDAKNSKKFGEAVKARLKGIEDARREINAEAGRIAGQKEGV